MSTGETNTSLTEEETHKLDGNEVGDVNNASTGSSVPIKSEKVPQHIRVATDPLSKQLEKVCDFMTEPCRDTVKRDEGTSAQLKVP